MYDLPDVDVLGGTYYMSDATASLGAALTMVGGRKAVIVKEFGVVGDASFASVGLVLSGLEYWSGDPELGLGGLLSGALLWSLRGHAAGGGFYWHYEVSSNGTFPASLHWPGFSSGVHDGGCPSNCRARGRAPLAGIEGEGGAECWGTARFTCRCSLALRCLPTRTMSRRRIRVWKTCA